MPATIYDLESLAVGEGLVVPGNKIASARQAMWVTGRRLGRSFMSRKLGDGTYLVTRVDPKNPPSVLKLSAEEASALVPAAAKTMAERQKEVNEALERLRNGVDP